MWELDFAGQIYTFLFSLLFGAGYSLLYELFRLFRTRCFRSGTADIVIDILYCVVTAFAEFCFFLSRTGGELRGYVIVGNLLGFFAAHKTVAPPVYRLLSYAMLLANGLGRLARRLIFDPLRRLFTRFGGFFIKILKKSCNFMKKRLKKPDTLVYTKEKCPQDGN